MSEKDVREKGVHSMRNGSCACILPPFLPTRLSQILFLLRSARARSGAKYTFYGLTHFGSTRVVSAVKLVAPLLRVEQEHVNSAMHSLGRGHMDKCCATLCAKHGIAFAHPFALLSNQRALAIALNAASTRAGIGHMEVCAAIEQVVERVDTHANRIAARSSLVKFGLLGALFAGLVWRKELQPTRQLQCTDAQTAHSRPTFVRL